MSKVGEMYDLKNEWHRGYRDCVVIVVNPGLYDMRDLSMHRVY
jgi:hypothetical protein